MEKSSTLPHAGGAPRANSSRSKTPHHLAVDMPPMMDDRDPDDYNPKPKFRSRHRNSNQSKSPRSRYGILGRAATKESRAHTLRHKIYAANRLATAARPFVSRHGVYYITLSLCPFYFRQTTLRAVVIYRVIIIIIIMLYAYLRL